MATEIVNTTGWKTPWLRKVIRYCCRELEFPQEELSKATFSLSHRGHFKGKAYIGRRLIIVRLNPLNDYPLIITTPKALPEFQVNDPIDLLVYLTAHEIAHHRFADRTEQHVEGIGRNVTYEFAKHRETLLPRWGEAGPGPVRPTKVYRWECRRCGNVSRSARPTRTPERHSCGHCFASWKEAEAAGEFLTYTVEAQGGPAGQPRQEKPRRDFVKPRALKVADMLARWERKLKLAQSKVKQYRAKVNYYRKKGILPEA